MRAYIGKVVLLTMTFHLSHLTAGSDIHRLAVSLCDYAKADDRTSMRRKLKSSRMQMRVIYPAIQCGSTGSLLRVAITNNANEAAKFLASKVGSDNLAKEESDGMSILQYAESLVANGDASKQVFVDLIKSKM